MTLDTLRESIKNELVLQNGNVFAGQWQALGLVQVAAGLGIAGPDFLALINRENQALAPNLNRINTLKTTIGHLAKGQQNTLTDAQQTEFINEAGLLGLSRSFVVQEWMPAILTGLPPQPTVGPKPPPRPVLRLNWKILTMALVSSGLLLLLVWPIYTKTQESAGRPIPLISSLPAIDASLPVLPPSPKPAPPKSKPAPPVVISSKAIPQKPTPQTPVLREPVVVTGRKRGIKPGQRFDEIGTDRNESGLRPARKNQQWGYINANDEWVIRPQYKYARPFRKGRAHVFDTNCICWLFIDQDGQQQP